MFLSFRYSSRGHDLNNNRMVCYCCIQLGKYIVIWIIEFDLFELYSAFHLQAMCGLHRGVFLEGECTRLMKFPQPDHDNMFGVVSELFCTNRDILPLYHDWNLFLYQHVCIQHALLFFRACDNIDITHEFSLFGSSISRIPVVSFHLSIFIVSQSAVLKHHPKFNHTTILSSSLLLLSC